MSMKMNQVKFKYTKKPICSLKYEMTKRKEKWKAINDPAERQLSIPLEAQYSVVQECVSEAVYNSLATMLDMPQLSGETTLSPSVETIVPYNPPETTLPTDVRDSVDKRTRASTVQSVLSGYSTPSQYESLTRTVVSQTESQNEVQVEPEKNEDIYDYDGSSDVVEVESKVKFDRQMMLRQKAILRFLNLPEEEAASWRVKDAKDVSDLRQMTLEEKGDFLINKIAVDFCKWIKELGGDEKSFISEEIVKELFQIGMDNPASRAICMKTREKKVLYYNLATFL
ncbi:uncharacterized protein LOC128988463 [Macrosteles quadrilineatus]|uniref:uncharacterized protein LOC128988463 n=1 Tax=Macrosteles quadrilineatus TaxID=74068 RepID=UPI0023E33299|nr:uncharacterized protein LOC128988463 [Macrosteles quadrilineatus]